MADIHDRVFELILAGKTAEEAWERATIEEKGGVLYPHIKVRLVGEDGNAWAIMGRVTRAMKKAGLSQQVQDEYRAEAMSGDYNNLLYVTTKWVGMAPARVCEGCGSADDPCDCDDVHQDWMG